VAFMGVSKTGGRAGGLVACFLVNVTIHTNTDLRKLESAVQAAPLHVEQHRAQRISQRPVVSAALSRSSTQVSVRS
jgi:hypothetical protein